MTNPVKKLNLPSAGASWQNFLNAMIGFINSRIKGEPTAELYKHGLEVFLHLPGSKTASLFLLDTEGYLFHHSLSFPQIEKNSIGVIFEELLNSGAIATALQSNANITWELNPRNSLKRIFLLNPLVDGNGVVGIVIVELDSKKPEYEQLLLGLCGIHSHQFTSLINNIRLYKELQNTQSILEQRISFRTEDLRRSKRDLQLILDSIQTGVFIIDPKTNRIFDTNLAATEILRMPRESVLNCERDEFNFHRNHKSDNETDTSELTNGESSLRNKDGLEIPIIKTMTNINFGDQVFILESFVDISERKMAMKALVESESRFRTIFEKAGIGMVITDLNGNILESNSTFCDMLGYKQSELIKLPFSKFVVPEEKKEHSSSSIQKKNSSERKFIKKGNRFIWSRVTNSYIRDAYDRPLFELKMVEDISERRNHEETLERQTNLLNGLADATTELLREMNFDKAISNALGMIGRAAMVDRIFIYQYHDEGNEIFLEWKYSWANDKVDNLHNEMKSYPFRIKKSISSWFSLFIEDRTICGLTSNVMDEERKFLEHFKVKSFLAVPIIIEEQVWGVVGLSDCTSDRMWTENEESILKAISVAIGGAMLRSKINSELVKSKDKAEKAFKLKSEFLAQMSHEIRTPINSILNFSGIIKEELSRKIDDDLRTGLKIIDKAGRRIIRTVDLILNMSDIQTGHYDYSPVRLNLFTDVLERQYYEFIQHARDKNIDFKLNHPNFNTELYCDEYTVNQIFNNLIDNALKYTMKGKVEIFAEKVNDHIVVNIKDTGIGISEKYMPRLFDAFTQEEQGYSRKFEGNGLGLALVKKYCELNNASLDVESAKGEGSTFRVTFSTSTK